MADNRIDSLSVLLQTNASYKDTLAVEVGKVIDNFSKKTISSLLKNTDLSGNPMSGTVEAKRFANATIQTYGTARSGKTGNKIKALPVPVQITDNKEFVEEVEEKDLEMYGINGLIEKRVANREDSMRRYFERKFFSVGVTAGSSFAVSGSTVVDKIESLIQKLETVSNDFVDGVERDQMAIILSTSTYGTIRSYIDTTAKSNVNTDIQDFGRLHGVLVFSSIYLPYGVDYVIMAKGAVAQPIRQSILNPTKVELSDATAFGMFLYSGTTAVTPDLIFFAGTLGTAVTITSAYAGTANTSTITITGSKLYSTNTYYYKAHASEVASPAFGDDATVTANGWTAMTLTTGAQDILFATQTKIRVAEVNAEGKIVAVSAETSIVKTGA